MDQPIEDTYLKKSDFLSALKTYFDSAVAGIGNIFKPATGKTRYADILVFNEMNQFLILRRSSMSGFEADKWCLPGGHVDEGEDFEEAAYRELVEETGLYGILLEEFVTYENDEAQIHIYGGVMSRIKPITLDNSEHFSYEFIKPEEIDNYAFILDLGEHLKEWLGVHTEDVEKFNLQELKPIMKSEDAFEILTEAFDKGAISDTEYLEIKLNYDLIKAKQLPISKDSNDEETDDDDEDDESSDDSSENNPANNGDPKKSPKLKKQPVINQAVPDWQAETVDD